MWADASTRIVRVLVLGEHDAVARRSITEALASLRGQIEQLMIAGVAGPLSGVASFAPLTGAIHLGLLESDLLDTASMAAWRTANAAPRELSVRHCATRCWADALRLVSGYDALIVAAPPTRRRDRRALERAAAGRWTLAA